MQAHLEWITTPLATAEGIIRIGIIRGGANFTYGAPYEFVCTILRVDDNAMIMGAHGTFSRELNRVITQIAKSECIANVGWERVNNKHRMVKRELFK